MSAHDPPEARLMPDEFARYTVAAVQAAPVFLDREATIDKACRLIDDAGRRGARVIVFPETWVPAYPFWQTAMREPWLELYKNAVEVPSPHVERLGEAARKAGAYVVIGINERDTRSQGTLYNSLLYLGPDGGVMGVHRKLMPTAGERLVWGWGDGSGLHVFDTPLGRLGGLICWEHEMTLVKYAMYARGEQLHASVWPAWCSQRDHIQFGTRQYAFEGRTFVVVAAGVLDEAMVPDAWRETHASVRNGQVADGGSAIIGPNGEYLAGPVYEREETLYADVDLSLVALAKRSLDTGGHYSRPDVARLLFDPSPKDQMITLTPGEKDLPPTAFQRFD